MQNILNTSDQNKIIERINSLTVISQGLWGKMDVSQMICHCTDQIKMAEEKIKIEYAGNFFLTKIMKNLILLGMPAPKGKVKTYRELDQLKSGTKPTLFENDRKKLIEKINNFAIEYPNNVRVVHPSFGEMSKNEWGKLIYIHLDHHLRQFNV